VVVMIIMMMVVVVSTWVLFREKESTVNTQSALDLDTMVYHESFTSKLHFFSRNDFTLIEQC